MADLDLDKLAAMVAAMTPGPWSVRRDDSLVPEGDPWFEIDAPSSHGVVMCASVSADDERNAAGIVAMRNAADELLRLARVGQAYAAMSPRLREHVEECDFCPLCGHHPSHPGHSVNCPLEVQP